MGPPLITGPTMCKPVLVTKTNLLNLIRRARSSPHRLFAEDPMKSEIHKFSEVSQARALTRCELMGAQDLKQLNSIGLVRGLHERYTQDTIRYCGFRLRAEDTGNLFKKSLQIWPLWGESASSSISLEAGSFRLLETTKHQYNNLTIVKVIGTHLKIKLVTPNFHFFATYLKGPGCQANTDWGKISLTKKGLEVTVPKSQVKTTAPSYPITVKALLSIKSSEPLFPREPQPRTKLRPESVQIKGSRTKTTGTHKICLFAVWGQLTIKSPQISLKSVLLAVRGLGHKSPHN